MNRSVSRLSLTVKAAWPPPPTTRSRSVAQVMCACLGWRIQVKLVVSTPRVSLPLLWLPRRMLQKKKGALGGRESPQHEEQGVAGWMGRLLPQRDGELQPIAARHVAMHNVSQGATVFIICKLCWIIDSRVRVWVNISVSFVCANAEKKINHLFKQGEEKMKC